MKQTKSKNFEFSEKEFLDTKFQTYVAGQSAQDDLIRELVVETFDPFIKQMSGLEFGCSDGYMTQLLSTRLEQLDVVEGSELFIKKAESRNL